MPWVKLDDQLPEHPKYARLGPWAALAFALDLAGIAWCSRHLTDGWIPKGHVPRLWSFDGMTIAGEAVSADVLARMLVDPARRWEDRGDEYEIRGYLEHNPSREQVLRDRQARNQAKVEAGRLGGIQSGLVRRTKQQGSTDEAGGEANGKQTGSPVPVPVPVPTPVPDPETRSPGDPPTPLPRKRGSKVKPPDDPGFSDWYSRIHELAVGYVHDSRLAEKRARAIDVADRPDVLRAVEAWAASGRQQYLVLPRLLDAGNWRRYPTPTAGCGMGQEAITGRAEANGHAAFPPSVQASREFLDEAQRLREAGL